MQRARRDWITPEQREEIERAVERGLAPLFAPEPLKLSEWADEHFYLSAESSSVAGAWETIPYQRAIMNCISNDDIRIITWMKSARTGYTKIICAALGYFAEHKKRNQVVYQPTDSDAVDFVKDEIDPMLRDVPVVRNIMKSDPDKKSADNTQFKKSFLGSTLDIRGGKAARNYRRLTKDVVFYDELDGFDQDIEGEGSPLVLGDARVTTSSFPKSIRGSTPGTKGLSRIEESAEESVILLRRHLPCPECGEFQALKWNGMTWVDRDPQTARYTCEHCGSAIEYKSLGEMDARGVWRSDDGRWIDEDDLFRAPDGSVIEAPSHVAFHIWAAYSYFRPWADLVAEFLRANDAAKRGDTTQLKAFVNTKLGEAWEERGDQVESDSLVNRRERYPQQVPEGALVLTVGADVQQDRIELEVVGWGDGEESWGVAYHVLWGDPKQPRVWSELDALLLASFDGPDGQVLNISAACIDSGYLTDYVYDFVRTRQGRRVFAVKGVEGAGRPIISAPRKQKTSVGGLKLVTIGVDEAKGIVHSRLKVGESGAGYCHFPESYSEEYFAQLAAEKLVTRFRRGFPVRKWVKTRPRNEALDCRVYAYAALKILNPSWNALRAQGQVVRPAQQVRRRPSSYLR